MNKRSKFAKAFGKFIAFSIIAVLALTIVAISLSITWRALSWAFGL